ncbi:uncharacterized protein LAJ45_07597 [Morchella importuna]|uniref:uncharacterized protein n=1 Tax=Morchella importuna TaxID=1174673 RepID=UPI001E8D8082|nr:uncharacterized protein LAJ45_07597 [Morchella importuna]KAH8148494.1 hypothetical protein LAJ45_07597 [Morchella importuna]
MFKTLKSRLPRSLSLSRSRSRKAAAAPPEAQSENENPTTTTAAFVEKTPAPYLPAPRRKTSTLFELEALLSSIIDSHHHCGQDARAVIERGEKAREGSSRGGVLPSYEELYKELEREKEDAENPQVPEISGFMTVQSVPHVPIQPAAARTTDIAAEAQGPSGAKAVDAREGARGPHEAFRPMRG